MKAERCIVPERRCERCRYFVRHYARRENGQFMPLACGGCQLGKSRAPELDISCSAYREIEGAEEACATYQINWKWD